MPTYIIVSYARAAAGLGILCLLLSLPAGAAVMPAGVIDGGTTAVIAEYVSRQQADAAARRLHAEGRAVEVREGQRETRLNQLEVGYFTGRAEAQRVQAALTARNVTATLIVQRKEGIAVAVGAYADAGNLARQRARLASLGVGEVHVRPLLRETPAYQLVQLAEAMPPSNASKPTAIAAADAVESYRYPTRQQADAKAEALRAQGRQVSVRTVTEPVRLQSLQLRGYPHLANAQQAVAKLKEFGITAQAIKDKARGDYTVSAGVFSNADNLRRLERRLRDIGFDNIAVIPIERSVERYAVEVARPPAPVVVPAPTAPAAVEITREAASEIAAMPHETPPAAAVLIQPSNAEPAEPEVLVFGDSPGSGLAPAAAEAGVSLESEAARTAERRPRRVRLDQARIEAGAVSGSAATVDASHYLKAALSAQWAPAPHWEVQLTARLDGYQQTGTSEFDDLEADYGDSFVRYRGENTRVTAGSQTVIWGRVDAIPPTDRMSTQDVTRLVLDDLEDRRRAAPAVRVEHFSSAFKSDLLWVPWFRAAEMPALDSLWSPVDQTRGRLLGMQDTASFRQLIQGASVSDDDDHAGGLGVRFSRAGKNLDYAVTLQSTRHSAPYYELDEAARQTLLATGNAALALAAASGPTFVGRHPRTTVLGGDVGFEAADATWRFEAAYLSDVPVTTTDLRLVTLKGLDWVAGVEFYPGQADTRLVLQLSGHHVLDAPAMLDRNDVYTLNGEMESQFAHNRWRAKLRYSLGLDDSDAYLNPEIAFLGAEPHELYLGVHYFDGADNTLGGFHQDHDLVTLGWRASF